MHVVGFVEDNMSSDMFADKDAVVSLVQRCGYFLGKADRRSVQTMMWWRQL